MIIALTNPCQDPCGHLTDDQHDRMRKMSKECFCTARIHDNEYSIWHAIVSADPVPGYLHRHLGGCLDLSAQRWVARAIWSSLDDENRHLRMQDVREQLSKQE